MRSDLPQTRPILEKRAHGDRAATLTVEFKCPFTPGQFVMFWLPGIDEKPFSVSRHQPGRIDVTIKRLGEVSSQMVDLDVGDPVGIRGPYGNGYTVPDGLTDDNCLFVSGGVGLAAVAPLMDAFPRALSLYGENTAADRLLGDRFPDLRFFTMDGSAGEKGFPTDPLPAVLEERRPEIVFTCGPEIMMRKVAEACREQNVACQISLERYMKCAVGVCGQCCMDGERVCADGPVFTGERLLSAKDFGFRKLDKSGTWLTMGGP